jgi:hypothetical protein
MMVIYLALGNFGDNESPGKARLYASTSSFGIELVRNLEYQ